jgi:hypothetical protein
VAFNADPAMARKDVDRMMRSLFQPEVIDGEEAIQVCGSRGQGRPFTPLSWQTSRA